MITAKLLKELLSCVPDDCAIVPVVNCENEGGFYVCRAGDKGVYAVVNLSRDTICDTKGRHHAITSLNWFKRYMNELEFVELADKLHSPPG